MGDSGSHMADSSLGRMEGAWPPSDPSYTEEAEEQGVGVFLTYMYGTACEQGVSLTIRSALCQ